MMVLAVIFPRNHPLYSFFISSYQHNLKLGVNPNIRKMKTGGKRHDEEEDEVRCRFFDSCFGAELYTGI